MRPDGRMSTNPVAVLYDGTHVRVSATADRRKIRNLRADDRITLCVVQPGNLNRYVEIRGRAVSSPTTIARSSTRSRSATWVPTAIRSTKTGSSACDSHRDREAISRPTIPLAACPAATTLDRIDGCGHRDETGFGRERLGVGAVDERLFVCARLVAERRHAPPTRRRTRRSN